MASRCGARAGTSRPPAGAARWARCWRGRADDGRLDGGERQEVLDTLIAVLGGAYAHLPAKRAAYAIDPVHELELLRRRASDLSDAEFSNT